MHTKYAWRERGPEYRLYLDVNNTFPIPAKGCGCLAIYKLAFPFILPLVLSRLQTRQPRPQSPRHRRDQGGCLLWGPVIFLPTLGSTRYTASVFLCRAREPGSCGLLNLKAKAKKDIPGGNHRRSDFYLLGRVTGTIIFPLRY